MTISDRDIPHLPIVIGVCVVAVAGYALFSVYAVIWLRDATMTGDIIGTWKSFAVAAFAFWLGSSSGGKAKGKEPTGTVDNPTIVEGAGPNAEPVPTREG
jgi:hypothetical protein